MEKLQKADMTVRKRKHSELAMPIHPAMALLGKWAPHSCMIMLLRRGLHAQDFAEHSPGSIVRETEACEDHQAVALSESRSTQSSCPALTDTTSADYPLHRDCCCLACRSQLSSPS